MVTSKETHCYIKLKIKPPDDPSACYLNETTEIDDPTMCDIAVPAWTKFGLEQTGSTRCGGLPTDMTINGVTIHDSYRLRVMLEQVNTITEALKTKVQIKTTELIGQQLFDTYKLATFEVCKNVFCR